MLQICNNRSRDIRGDGSLHGTVFGVLHLLAQSSIKSIMQVLKLIKIQGALMVRIARHRFSTNTDEINQTKKKPIAPSIPIMTEFSYFLLIEIHLFQFSSLVEKLTTNAK